MVQSIAMYHEQVNQHHSFAYTQLNDQTVLFLAIQFSISHFFCTQFKCQKVLFDPYIGAIRTEWTRE